MDTIENLSTTQPSGNQPAKKDYRNAIIAVLAFCFVGTAGYMVVDKNKNTEIIQQQQTQISKVTDEKADLRRSFDASVARLDSMTTMNTGLESKLTASNDEISKQKSEIRSILNKKNASDAELKKAKGMIAKLNDNISGMEQQIATLTKDNETLTQDKAALTADKEKLTQDLNTTTTAKQELEKKVDIASTLNASNINITPINVRHNGKEKVSTTAKRVDKLMITFDVDNRIAPPGPTDVYVCITGPDGKIISSDPSGAASTFTTREDGDKTFSAKVAVVLETAKTKNVEFAFTPGKSFAEGKYVIQIYHNGFKIGEGVRELKKGGLFS